MVWFGSTIFSTSEQLMILSKCHIKSLLSVKVCGSLRKNAYRKLSEVTQSQGVTLSKSWWKTVITIERIHSSQT